jgi:hypothetical protein
LSEYRLVLTKKPTINLWLIEGKKRKRLASTKSRRAGLLREEILPILQLTEYMSWRDGRINYNVTEESAIRVYLAMKIIKGVVDWSRVSGYVKAVKNMDRGEVLSWYSLTLKLGSRALRAMRTAYYK